MPGKEKVETSEKTEGRGGFLEKLLLGSFDEKSYKTLAQAGRDPRAEEIIEKYRELIKDYPPSDLEEKKTIPEPLMKGLKEIGLFGLNVPEKYGGVGLGLSGYLSVLEAMAGTDMSLALTPTAHLSIGIKGIILFGSKKQKKKYLTKAATGEMIFAYALTEPATGSDAKHIQTTALLSEDGKHYILNGQKTFITNANYAGGLTVFAQMDPDNPGFMGAFIVETAWDGVKVGKEMSKMGLAASSTAPIGFKDVKVPAQNLIGKPGDGFKIAMTILNYGRLGLGAASVGAMKQSVKDMFDRASSREQFGVPIRDFELIQEKIVRARVHAFAAESITQGASGLLEGDHTGSFAMESSHVKLYGTTRAWDTLYDALQTAGGAGYLRSLPYEKRMRDFRVTTLFEGTSEIHSIYPALYLARSLGKQLSSSGKGRIGQAFFLIREGLRSPKMALRHHNSVTRRAARMARRNVRAIRRLLYFGILRHGSKIAEKEFLLRRITWLSLDLYILLASLSGLEHEIENGTDVKDRLSLLAYFLTEARENWRLNACCYSRKRERIHQRIFRNLSEEFEGNNETTSEGRQV